MRNKIGEINIRRGSDVHTEAGPNSDIQLQYALYRVRRCLPRSDRSEGGRAGCQVKSIVNNKLKRAANPVEQPTEACATCARMSAASGWLVLSRVLMLGGSFPLSRLCIATVSVKTPAIIIIIVVIIANEQWLEFLHNRKIFDHDG